MSIAEVPLFCNSIQSDSSPSTVRRSPVLSAQNSDIQMSARLLEHKNKRMLAMDPKVFNLNNVFLIMNMVMTKERLWK
jgi:hypothetical protein